MRRSPRAPRALKRTATLSAAVAVTLAPLVPALAANTQFIYNGPGGTTTNPQSGTFNTAGNWNNGAGPVPASAATTELDFNSGATAYTATDDISGALTLNEIQLNLLTPNAGGGGTITASSTGAPSLNFAVNGTVNPTVLQNGTGAFTFNIPVAVAAAANPLTFGGLENTAGAGTTSAAGTPNGNVTLNGVISGAGGLIFGGTSTASVLTATGGIDGGYNTTILTGADSYTGPTTLSAGGLTLDFTTDTTAPSNRISTGALTLSGGTLTVLGSAAVATNQSVSGTTLNGGTSIVVNSGAGHTATFNLGAITRTIGGAADFSGTGTVNTNTPNSSGTILGGWATSGGGSTFAVSAGTAGTAGAITGLSNYTTSGATLTATGDIDVSSGPVATGGALTVNSLRFNSAATTLNTGGALTVASGGILMTPTASGAVVINNNTLTSGNGTDLVINQYNTANALTINSAVSGTIGLTKAGPGNLVLGTANTYTGDTYIDGGTLTSAGGNGSGTAGPFGILSGTQGTAFKRVVLTNGGTFHLTATYNDNTPSTTVQGQVFFIGAGGGRFNIDGTFGLILDDGTTTGTGTGAAEFQGFGDLTKIGSGTLSLGNGGTNFSTTFTGQIIINQGTVMIGTASTAGTNLSPLGSTSAGTVVNSGGTLELNGQNIGAEPLTINGGTLVNSGTTFTNGPGSQGNLPATASGPVTLVAGATNSVGGTGTGGLTLSGVVSGAGALTKVGTGALTLSGANTYTGGTTVSAGTLILGNGATGSAAGTGNVTLNGGTLATTTAGGTMSGAVLAGSAAHTIAPGGVYGTGSAFNATVGTLNVGALTAGANTTLNFDLTTPGGTGDLLNITTLNGFTETGTPSITLGQLPSQAGTYHLISFTSTSSTTPSLSFNAPASSGNGRLTYAVQVDPGTSTNQYFVDLLASGTSGGRNYVFVGNSTPSGDSWIVPANYNPPNDGTVPGVAGDTVTINNGSSTAYTINLNGQQHVGSLNFNNTGGTGSYTLAAGSGGALFLDSGSSSTAATLLNSANSNTISAPVTLSTNTNVTAASGTTLTLSGVVSGGSGTTLTLTSSNAGTVLLSGGNTFTSNVVVSGGILKAGGGAFLGFSPSVTVNNGGTIDLNNFNTGQALFLNGTGFGGIGALTNSSGTSNLNTTSAVTLQSATTVNTPSSFGLTGVISGAGQLTKIGANTLTLTNTGNTFSGGFNITAGTVSFSGNNNNNVSQLGTGTVTITNNAVLQDNSTAQANMSQVVNIGSGGATLNLNQNQKWQWGVANGITGSGTITRTGAANTLTNNFSITGNNSTFNGAWVLNGGVIEANAGGLGSGVTTNTVTINSGAELANSNTTLPQNITINGGVLGGDNATGTAAGSTYSGAINAAGPFQIRLGYFYNTTTNQNLTLTGALSGSGPFGFLNAGIVATSGSSSTPNTGAGQSLNLSGNNSGYTAAFTVPNGYIITAQSPNALGTSATNTLTVASGATLDIQSVLNNTAAATVGGVGVGTSGALRNSSATNASFSGPITLSAATDFGVSGAGSLTLSGAVGGGLALTKVGTGTGALVLTNPNNTFTSVTVSGGTVQANADGALGPAASAVSLATGTALNLGGASTFGLSNPVTATGAVTMGGVNAAGTTATFNNVTSTAVTALTTDSANAGATVSFTNPLTGTSLTKGAGGGIVQLAGGSNFGAGAMTVNGGQLQLGGANAGTGTLTLNNSGTSLTSVPGGTVTLAASTVTSNAGTIIAPGGIGNATAATLSLGANQVTLNNGSQLHFDFQGGGTTNDLLLLTSGTASLSVASGNAVVQIANGPTTAGNYEIISDANPTAPSLSSFIVQGAPSGTSYSLTAQPDAGTGGNDIFLVVGNSTSSTFTYNPGNAAPAGGATGSFNAAGNWSPPTVPGAGSAATFPGLSSAGTHTVTLDAAQRVGSLTLDPGSAGNTGAYAFTAGAGGSLSVESGVTVNSGANTFAAPLTLLAPTTFAVNTAGDSAASPGLAITSAGSLSGAGALLKTGAGTLVVAGRATNTGGGTVSGGTLQFTNTLTGSLNSLSGTYAVGSSATLRASALGNGTATNGPTAAPNNALATAAVTLNGGTLALDPTSGATAGSFNTKFITAPNTNNLVFQYDYLGLGAIAGSPTTLTGQSGQTNGGLQFNANPATTTATAWYTGAPTANYLARFTGAIKITNQGNYSFQISSDDTSRLYIDNRFIAADDGGHGYGTLFSSANLNLSAGLHEFRVDYAQGAGGNQLTVNYAGQFTGSDTGLASGTYTPLTSSVLQTLDTIPMGNNVALTASSTIDTGATNGNFTQVGLGSLAFGQGSGTAATLTVNGLAGKSVHFAGGMTLQSGATNTVSDTPDVFVDGPAVLSSGTATLVKSGTGQLFLSNTLNSNPNVLNGVTLNIQQGRLVAQGSVSTVATVGSASPLAGASIQLSGGTLVLDSKAGNNSSTGPVFDNPVSVTASSTIEAQALNVNSTLGGTGSGNGINIASGTTLTVNPLSSGGSGTFGAQLTVPGLITGAGALVVNGTGVGSTAIPGALILAGANTYTGGTTVTAGTLQGNTVSLQGAIVDNSPASNVATAPGGVVFDQTFTGTFGGTISGTGALTVQNTGTVVVPGPSITYTGPTSVNSGVLSFSSSTGAMTGAFNFGNNNAVTTVGTLDLSSANATFGSMVVQTNSTSANLLRVGAAQSLTINGNVTIGSGQGANTTTVLNTTGGGSLVVNNNATNGIFTVGGTSGTSAVGNTATANFSGLSSLTISLNTTSGAVTVNPNITTGTTNVSGLQSTLILPSTGAGNTTITASRLDVGVGPTFNSVATQVNAVKLGTGLNQFNVGTVNIGSGTNRDFGSVTFNTSAGSIAINGTGGAATTTAFNLGTGATTTGTAGATNTFDVTGHTATLNFAAANIGTETRMGNYANVFAFDRGTLAMTGLTAGTRSGTALTASMTDTVTVNLGSAASTAADTATIGNTGINMAVANPTAAAFNATVNSTLNIGGGTVNVGATGGTSITMATATAASTGNTNTATALLNFNGGTTNLSGNIVKGSASGTGFATAATLTLAGGTLNMNGNSIGSTATPIDTINLQSGTLSNVLQINGGANVTKTTAGTLTLTGTNAYTGNTAVNAGLLLVNGTHSGAGNYSIASAATLGGTGTINLAAAATNGVSVASGGNFAPGSGAGTSLTVAVANASTTATAVTLADGSNFQVLLTHSNTPNILDGLNVPTGVVNLGSSTGPNLVLTQDGSLQGGETFTILDPTTINGAFAGGNSGTSNGIGYALSYNTAPGSPQTVTLTVTAVPEPASVGLLGLGTLGLLARRRRRPAGRA